jgi:hypothetical protein
MVVVYYKAKGSSEYKRESFMDVHMYLKWREYMGRKLADVRPVRNVSRGVRTWW